MTRVRRRDVLPTAINFNALAFFDPLTGEVYFVREEDGTRFMTINMRDGVVTILHETLAFTTTATESSAITFSDSSGTTKINMRITSGGFGFLALDQLEFNGNTNNQIHEFFGIVVGLADSAGTNGFQVQNLAGESILNVKSDGQVEFQDAAGADVWTMYANGNLVQNKAAFLELLGNIADPGGSSTANAARIYVKDAGGSKDRLAVEFTSGAAQTLATEP